MRKVTAQRTTRPMKSSKRQFRRRAVFGKFSSGLRLNKSVTVIITLWWRAIGIRFSVVNISIITYDEPVCNRFLLFSANYIKGVQL